MKITDIDTIPLQPDVGSVDMALGDNEQRVTVMPVVVKVHTSEDIVGLGETLAYTEREVDVIVEGIELLKRHLVETDPRKINRRWQELYTDAKRSQTYKPLSALDQALWDIAGKDAGKPLYELLGGRTGDLAAYATFPYRQSIDELIENGRWLAEKGFDSMKITVGTDVETDSRRIREVGSALPEGFGLSIDANTSFEYSQALQVAKVGEEYDLVWFEEPIPHTDINGQAELNKRTTVPIAAYQSHTPHYPAIEHLEANALEVYQPALYLCGGVTGGKRVAALTEAYNKRFVPHAFGPQINYAASVHVAAASPASDLIEFAIYDEEIDDPGRYVSSPYVDNQDVIYVDDDGTIDPPTDPGLGVHLDDDAVERYRIG